MTTYPKLDRFKPWPISLFIPPPNKWRHTCGQRSLQADGVERCRGRRLSPYSWPLTARQSGPRLIYSRMKAFSFPRGQVGGGVSLCPLKPPHPPFALPLWTTIHWNKRKTGQYRCNSNWLNKGTAVFLPKSLSPNLKWILAESSGW